MLSPGERVSSVSAGAALELGLTCDTSVGASLIDAHAGALGMLAGVSDTLGRLGLVSGTSTCHMLLSSTPTVVPGVWGPFLSAVLPGAWLLEAGQSSSGHNINKHYYKPKSWFRPSLCGLPLLRS